MWNKLTRNKLTRNKLTRNKLTRNKELKIYLFRLWAGNSCIVYIELNALFWSFINLQIKLIYSILISVPWRNNWNAEIKQALTLKLKVPSVNIEINIMTILWSELNDVKKQIKYFEVPWSIESFNLIKTTKYKNKQ